MIVLSPIAKAIALAKGHSNAIVDIGNPDAVISADVCAGSVFQKPVHLPDGFGRGSLSIVLYCQYDVVAVPAGTDTYMAARTLVLHPMDDAVLHQRLQDEIGV